MRCRTQRCGSAMRRSGPDSRRRSARTGRESRVGRRAPARPQPGCRRRPAPRSADSSRSCGSHARRRGAASAPACRSRCPRPRRRDHPNRRRGIPASRDVGRCCRPSQSRVGCESPRGRDLCACRRCADRRATRPRCCCRNESLASWSVAGAARARRR